MGKRLTIAGLQIYFGEQGTAQFTPKKKQRTAVEQVVREYQEFIEKWLKASEAEPRNIVPSEALEPREIVPEEQRMRSSFESLVKMLDDHPDRKAIAELLRNVVKKGRRYPNMTDKQIEEGIAHALSALDRGNHPRTVGTHGDSPGANGSHSAGAGRFPRTRIVIRQ